MAKYYFLATCLPPLPAALGERLLIPFPEIGQLVLRNIEPEDKPLVISRLLLSDVANIESHLQGWSSFVTGGLLTREEVATWKNLPSFIRMLLDDKERGLKGGYYYHRLWSAYYRYVYSVAETSGSRFLTDYLSWEIGLRNSLADMRSAVLSKEAEGYRITATQAVYDFSIITNHLKTQTDPLESEKFLDSERLKMIYHFEGPDPFTRDAILATLEKARIFSRWEKLSTGYDIQNII